MSTKTNTKSKEPVEVDADVRILRVETDSGFVLLPYLSFRSGEGSTFGKIESREFLLELAFDQGILTLRGRNLDELLIDLQCERVSVLRKGKSEDGNGLEINGLTFFAAPKDNPISAPAPSREKSSSNSPSSLFP